MTEGPNGASYWEARYVADDAPWDLGEAPPVLEDLLMSGDLSPSKVLIPGAGFGHDAIAFAAAGHEVTAIDIAPSAVEGMRAGMDMAGVQFEVVEADLFALPASLESRFDIVWEHTCFCAIDPIQREGYAAAMARVLKDDGILYGLFWNHGNPGGPPWSVTVKDVSAALGAHFDIDAIEPVKVSAPGRSSEFLATLMPVQG